jgi:uncharacterized protein (DUF1330 family)
MPVILTTIGTLESDGGDALARYACVVIPLIEAAQGTVLCRGAFREAIVGDDCPGFIAVMQFPHAERIHRMFASAEYLAALPDRQRAFREIRTFISDPI